MVSNSLATLPYPKTVKKLKLPDLKKNYNIYLFKKDTWQ